MKRVYRAGPGAAAVEVTLEDGTVLRGRRVVVRRYGRWNPLRLRLALSLRRRAAR